MLTTVHALLIAIFVLVPGFIADRTYREFVGSAKRDATYQVLLWLAWSLVSGALYTGVAYVTHESSRLGDLPYLEYSTLDWLASANGEFQALPPRWLLLLTLHLSSAALLGAALGGLGCRWDFFGLGYRYQTTWDHALTTLAGERYVIVEMKNGTMWFGSVHIANRMADTTDRDLVLKHPRVYTADGGLGVADVREYLYLPGREIHLISFLNKQLPEDSPTTEEETDARQEQSDITE